MEFKKPDGYKNTHSTESVKKKDNAYNIYNILNNIYNSIITQIPKLY